MLHARAQLMRQVQTLFETHLRGLYRWGEVAILPPDEVDKVPGQRRQAFGKYKEVVSVRFGIFDLTVESPNEWPPLGRVRLDGPETVEVSSLDASAWDRIGSIIKHHHEGVDSYV